MIIVVQVDVERLAERLWERWERLMMWSVVVSDRAVQVELICINATSISLQGEKMGHFPPDPNHHQTLREQAPLRSNMQR